MNYDRARLIADLIRDENEKLLVYRCTANKLTIGVGRNLDDVGISALETRALGLTKADCIARGITKDQSRALLLNDIAGCERDLDRRLPWWRTIDPVRQRVLLNMCFNLGIVRLMKFKNTLAMIESRDFESAAGGMKASLWYRQVKDRAVRLARMMETGKEPA